MNKLSAFVLENKVKTVLDIGCGDWQFSRYMDWSAVEYEGLDCVAQVIETNQKQFTQDNVHFRLHDVLTNPELIPAADLYLLKDVIQHWPTADILRCLPNLLPKCKHLIVTNCRGQRSDDSDCILGGWRQLSMSKPPLKDFTPELLLTFKTKEMLLIRGTEPTAASSSPVDPITLQVTTEPGTEEQILEQGPVLEQGPAKLTNLA